MKISKVLILVLLPTFMVFSSIISLAQEHDNHKEEKHDNGGHRISLIMANALIDNSFSNETNDLLIVPGFGLNYDYFINAKWGLGIHSDILIQQFKLEKHGHHDEEIVRENPIALCGMLLYKPHHRWTIFSGYGVELEKNENFQLIRLGAEYGIELPKNWELGFSLEFDFKPDAYNSLLFGIGFSKTFNNTSK